MNWNGKNKNKVSDRLFYFYGNGHSIGHSNGDGNGLSIGHVHGHGNAHGQVHGHGTITFISLIFNICLFVLQ